jgi:hypothetical protein
MSEAISWPPLPSDDALREQAQLVARGVRPLALVGSCSLDRASAVRHYLLRLGVPGAIPFVVPHGDGAECGYAARAWVVETLTWVWTVPERHRHRVLGLLLGYSAEAIGQFDEMVFAEPGRVVNGAVQ